jgi:hyperosmotically inducible periplasmic protein
MKLNQWTALLLIAASPAALLASADVDRKIEEAAKGSYNFRTVLVDRVDVKCRDGVVTLAGSVPDREQRDLAAETVADLPGVVRVENDITVSPGTPEHSDQWIALSVRSTLLLRPHVSATATTVNVSNGVVTLKGTAANAAQRELTEEYAKEVEGVKAVANYIVVTPNAPAETVGEDIDDASITGQLKIALLSHSATSALKTKVSTENGVVRISGEADSEAEKALVTELASTIRGVRSVENAMTVRS